jgi:tRNA wybutosine-synthesizing protein 1
MEDLGGVAPKKGLKSSTRGSGTATRGASNIVDSVPEMLTPIVRASLSKQGYKLIGSHSGVKMCRWTKSMLRGR